MKTSYRGFTIDAHREKCMGGWSLLYYSIYRESDGYECVCNFEDSAERARDKVVQLKRRVDAELMEKHPWDECVEELT